MHYRSPVVFSLGGWSPLLHTSFHGTGATQDQKHHSTTLFAYGAVTLYGWPSQTIRLSASSGFALLSYNPTANFRLRWFGLLPFRSPLLRESLLISFPRGTKMFQFPRSPLACLLNSACDARSSTRQVTPFGNPRIFACLRLPVAFRSLPRPSSAPVPRHPPCALSSLDLHRQSQFILPHFCFPPIHLPSCLSGGLRWTRTTDLTLIRRTL